MLKLWTNVLIKTTSTIKANFIHWNKDDDRLCRCSDEAYHSSSYLDVNLLFYVFLFWCSIIPLETYFSIFYSVFYQTYFVCITQHHRKFRQCHPFEAFMLLSKINFTRLNKQNLYSYLTLNDYSSYESILLLHPLYSH